MHENYILLIESKLNTELTKKKKKVISVVSVLATKRWVRLYIYMEYAAISFSNFLVAMRKHYEIIKKM
jgi:hypothetical protein